jgi:bifunctional non-homologous end joining protein LigD
MSRLVKRSAPQAVKSGRAQQGVPLPTFVPFQLSKPVEKPPSGPQWLHEIKLDGYRMAARIDSGRVQLLTRTGLDWTAKYPSGSAYGEFILKHAGKLGFEGVVSKVVVQTLEVEPTRVRTH